MSNTIRFGYLSRSSYSFPHGPPTSRLSFSRESDKVLTNILLYLKHQRVFFTFGKVFLNFRIFFLACRLSTVSPTPIAKKRLTNTAHSLWSFLSIGICKKCLKDVVKFFLIITFSSSVYSSILNDKSYI